MMHSFPTPNMEEEADTFASCFLVPTEDVKPYFAGRRVDLRLLAALKPEWKVSMGVAGVRRQARRLPQRDPGAVHLEAIQHPQDQAARAAGARLPGGGAAYALRPRLAAHQRHGLFASPTCRRC